MAISPTGLLHPRQGLACGDRGVEVAEDGLQRPHAQQHILRPTAVAHQPDAPDLAGQGTQPGADLQVVFLQQAGAHQRFVHAFRYRHRVQLRQAVRLRDDEPQAEGFQAGPQRQMMVSVTGPCVLQSLVCQQHQRLVQAI